MRTPLPLATLAASYALLGAISPAGAAMMSHHDLSSLVYDSQVVVRAERVGGTDDQGQYRVTRVLTGGGLAAGATVTVEHTCYELHGAAYVGIRLPPLEPTTVLFLMRDPLDASALRLVPSGLRILAGGKVYRFEQWSNPGCYVPVPQGPDPDDLEGETPPAAQLDLSRLEAAVARAVARVARVRAALALTDAAARRTALLALLPPPRDRGVPESGRGNGFFEDRLAAHLFDDLLRAGDVVGALEVHARMHGMRPWLAREVTDERLMAEVMAPGAPVHRRAAAVELIRLPPAEVATELVQLARADASPEVRAAAYARLGALSGTSSDDDWARRKRRLRGVLSGLLRERAAAETSPLVRLALIGAAEDWRIGLPLRGVAGVALLARREGDHVRYWVGVAAPARTNSTPRLERAGAPCAFEVVRSWSTGQTGGGGELAARCGPGPLDLVVTTPRGVVTQHL